MRRREKKTYTRTAQCTLTHIYSIKCKVKYSKSCALCMLSFMLEQHTVKLPWGPCNGRLNLRLTLKKYQFYLHLIKQTITTSIWYLPFNWRLLCTVCSIPCLCPPMLPLHRLFIFAWHKILGLSSIDCFFTVPYRFTCIPHLEGLYFPTQHAQPL